MSEPTNFDLQVIITSGLEAPYRALAGLVLALSAAVSGSRVVIWLTMHGANWAACDQGNQEDVKGFSSIAEHLHLLVENGARIELCTACMDNGCLLQGMGEGRTELRPGIHPAGSVIVAARLGIVPTVTF